MTELTRKQVETMLAEATKRANEIPQEAADRENSCSACCGPYGSETWDDYADHQDRILLLGLSTVARALIAAWDREAKLREALAFYGDVADYKAPFTGAMGKLWGDCGETARAALTP